METEIKQLLSMGFPSDLAAQALAAAAGNLHQATDWLLNHNIPQTQKPISPNSSPPIVQPKINRFFHKDHNPPKTHHDYEEIEEDEHSPSLIHRNKRPKPPHAPLAERMRPRVLEEVVGQDHLLAGDSLLRSAIHSGRLPSLVLWGPPGTGKTSIAKAIINSSCNSSSSYYQFVSLSAVNCGVKDVREAIDNAKKSKQKTNKKTLLFLDEVHRFNKSQQGSFLPVIEDGSIVFIGATTENPSFHLITPLLSRCRVLTLNPLKPEHITTLVKRAISDIDSGLAADSVNEALKFDLENDVLHFLSLHCDGDARVALNALEIASRTAVKKSNLDSGLCVEIEIALSDVKEALQCKHLAYDRNGEEHYNVISALIKSMRGSDADAAIYWLARMLEGGEEPLYIARRLVVFASEDIGLGDPQALTRAVSCYQGCRFVGMPECNVVLAQCVAYLALAPKSVCVSRAIGFARCVVKESVGGNEGVPLHLRNAPMKLMKDPDLLGQSYLPPALQGYRFLDWP